MSKKSSVFSEMILRKYSKNNLALHKNNNKERKESSPYYSFYYRQALNL